MPSAPLSPDDLAAAAGVAERACDLARQEILPRFRHVREMKVEWKADGSPVTEADRAAERVIRETLTSAYPDYGILGEEYGESGGGGQDDRPRWIVDPIDGTISFARGIPLFGTLIALMSGDAPVLGVIDLPALDDRFVGWQGGGCRRNGEPVAVSSQSDLTRSIISVCDPICFDWAGRRATLERLSREVPLLRGYTDAFGHAMVLSGGLDAMVDCHLSPWDAAATQILVLEAGGACLARKRARGKVDIVFGSPALVEQIGVFFDD